MNTRHSAPVAVLALMGMLLAADAAPRPIDNAKPGQWVLERHSTSHVTSEGSNFWKAERWSLLSTTSCVATETTYRLTWVDRIEGSRIHLKRQELAADLRTGLGPAKDVVFDRDGKKTEAASDEMKSTLTTDDEVAIEGDATPLKCKRTDVVVLDACGAHKTITWTSDQIPLFGLVKMVKLDENGNEIWRTELLRWGESGGCEKPVAHRQ
jgi:hypothetical protein